MLRFWFHGDWGIHRFYCDVNLQIEHGVFRLVVGVPVAEKSFP